MWKWMKRVIIGTPFEPFARRLYIRMDPSEGGRYDRETLAIMRRHLSLDSNCIDIGAHRGAVLKEITALSPNGFHYAFEPVPQHYQYLVKTFPHVKIFPFALSNVKEQRKFTHIINRPTRSGFMAPVEADGPAETILVQTDRLDNVIPRDVCIQLIKLDVEGAGFEVMQGALQTIIQHKPLIVFEHSTLSNDSYGVASENIYDFLTKECGMQISLLKSWLEKRPALQREEFSREVGLGKSFYFIAHPL